MSTPLAIEIELAGMSSEQGIFGDGQLPDRIRVPGHVSIEGDDLIWSWFHPDAPDPLIDFGYALALASEIPPETDMTAGWPEHLQGERPQYADPRGMLNAFVRIKDEEGVRGFASRFGVLGLCTHGLPNTHNTQCGHMYVATRLWNPVFHEPVNRWMDYVSCARAMLSAAARLHQGAVVPNKDWELIYRDAEGRGDIEKIVDVLRQRPGIAKTFLAERVNSWMKIGGVLPKLHWGGPADAIPHFRLTSGTFGLLAVQLMVSVAKGNNLFFCDGCGEPYLRRGRSPQGSRRNYCPDCGEKGANRHRQQILQSNRREKLAGRNSE